MTIMGEPYAAFLPRLSAVSATTASTISSSNRGTNRMRTGDGDPGVLSIRGNDTGPVMSTAYFGSVA